MPTTQSLSSRLTIVAGQVGLSVEIIEYCLETDLIQPLLGERDLVELRRIRRLQALEVNLPGIEIILRMRRRLLAMQAEMETMAARMAEMQARFESEPAEVD